MNTIPVWKHDLSDSTNSLNDLILILPVNSYSMTSYVLQLELNQVELYPVTRFPAATLQQQSFHLSCYNAATQLWSKAPMNQRTNGFHRDEALKLRFPTSVVKAKSNAAARTSNSVAAGSDRISDPKNGLQGRDAMKCPNLKNPKILVEFMKNTENLNNSKGTSIYHG